MIESILALKLLSPDILCLEQVVGFPRHQDYRFIIYHLEWAGYKLVYSAVHDLGAFSCTARPRWLGIACKAGVEVNEVSPKPWPSAYHTPNQLAFLVQFKGEELQRLIPSQDVLSIYAQPELLPYRQSAKDPQQALQARTYTGAHKLPTLMARYMSQHDINREHLLKKGLLGFFIAIKGQAVRFIHPVEGAMMHFIHEPVFIDKCLKQAWEIQGNAIAMPHALFALLVGLKAGNHLRAGHPEFADLIAEAQETVWKAHDLVKYGSVEGDIYVANHVQQYQVKALRFLRMAFNLAQHDASGALPSNTFVEPADDFAEVRAVIRRCESEVLTDTEVETTPCKERVHKARKLSHTSLLEDPIQECTPKTIEDPETSRELTPTETFLPSRRLSVQTQQQTYDIQIDCEVSHEDLEQLFLGGVAIRESQAGLEGVQGTTFMQIYQEKSSCPLAFVRHCTPCIIAFQDGRCPKEAISQLLQEAPRDWHDAFGVCERWPADGPIILSPVELRSSPELDVRALAKNKIHIAYATLPATNVFLVSLQGSLDDRKRAASFSEATLDVNGMAVLGRECKVEHNQDSSLVAWNATQDTAAAPLSVTKQVLSVAVTRALLGPAYTHGDISLKVKWQGQVLWQGSASADTSTRELRSILEAGIEVCWGDLPIRLVVNGKTLWIDVALGSLAREKTTTDPIERPDQTVKRHITIHVQHELTGGGPGETSKQARATAAKNDVATTLLQQGHNLHTATKTVEALLKKYGANRLTASMQGDTAHKTRTIEELCRDASIELPQASKMTAARLVHQGSAHKQKKTRFEIKVDRASWRSQ